MCILPQGGKDRVDCYVTKVKSLYVHVSVCIKIFNNGITNSVEHFNYK